MSNQTIRTYLEVIKRAVALIETTLDEEPELADEILEPLVVMDHATARKKHVSDLLAIDCWPPAVPDFLMTMATDNDQQKRATAVMDTTLDRSLDGLNFLDYGCGDGWITKSAINRGAAVATGYDIVRSEVWAKHQGKAKFTSVYHELERNFYDVVFLYDVLDHCADPDGLLKLVRQCMKKDAVAFVRCHPWTSRHATHLFKQGVNKAYLHLFLEWAEIRALSNQDPVFTRTEKGPLEAYRWWFRDCNILKETMTTEPVHEFFHVPAFKELLASEQKIPLEKIDEFLKLMEIQFVDYVLTPKA